MRKRILAVLTAMALVFSSAGPVQSEEILVEYAEDDTVVISETGADDDIAVISVEDTGNDMAVIPEEYADDAATVIQSAEEEITDLEEISSESEEVSSENSEINMDGLQSADDALVLSVEEVTAPELQTGENAVTLQTPEKETENDLEEVSVVLSESGMAVTAVQPAYSMYTGALYSGSYGAQLTGDAQYIYGQMVEKYARNHSMENISCTLTDVFTFHLDVTEAQINDKSYQNLAEYKEYTAQLMYPIQAAYDAFLFDHPEVFWMAPPVMSYSLKRTANAGGGYDFEISTIILKPQTGYENAVQDIAAFEEAVAAAESSVGAKLGGSSQKRDIVKTIHDYLCEKVSYDSSYASYPQSSAQYRYIHSAAGVFLDKNNYAVVCDGYAKAFKLLCDSFGVSCAIVPGYAGEPHAWNMVQMEDGAWYLVDVTWADQSNGISYMYFLADYHTMGSKGKVTGEERTAYANFSNAAYTHSFVLPQIYTVHELGEYSSNQDATCQRDGTKTAKCKYGCSLQETVTDTGTRYTEHTWDEGAVTEQATCSTEGKIVYTCLTCEKSQKPAMEEKAIPVNKEAHKWETDKRVDKEATCTEPGTQSIHCSLCDVTRDSEVLPLTEHVPDQGTITASTCTVQGSIVYKCQNCNILMEEETVPLPLESHRSDSGTVTAADCTADGSVIYRCLDCRTELSCEVLSATGHEFLNYVTETPPTVFEKGIQTAVCENCTATDSQEIECLKPFIKTNVSTIRLKVGQSTTKVKVTMADGDSVTSWKSKNKKIAAVGKTSGRITGKKTGTTTVTVKLKSGKQKKIKVIVQAKTVKTTKISGIPKKLTLTKGESTRLTATVKPITSGQKVRWSSSNSKVVSVNQKGKLTAKKTGKAVITVTSGSIRARCKVTVKKAPKTVSKTVLQAGLSVEENWEFAGTVSGSGRATQARLPMMRAFGAASYGGSYGSQLTGNAKRVYDGMVAAYVQNGKTDTVYVTLEEVLQYGISDKAEKEAVAMEIDCMVQAAFDAFKYDYPEIYWLGLVSYGALVKRQTADMETTCYVSQVRVIPAEDYTGAAAAAESAAFSYSVSAAYQKISSALDAGSTTAQKVRAIHDYLCTVTVYDEAYDTYTQEDPRDAYIHSAAGVFLKGGTAVCEGYAKAFKILCAKFGIESVLITGDALGGAHMWNYVKMDDGNWYLVDVTWDDQESGISYTYFLAGSLSMNAFGYEISLERLIYLNFSPSDYTMTFAVPVLAAYAYSQNLPVHTHTWTAQEGAKVTPTCQQEGYTVSVCSCGEKTVEFFQKTEHSFKNTTVYNQDATCVEDGTMTYYCDYGCGTVGKTVTAPDTKLPATYTVNADSLRLKKGQTTKKFKISGMGPGDYVYSWKSSKKSVVRVSGEEDGTCKITAKKTGKAEITAKLRSGTEIRIPVRVQKKAVSPTEIQEVPGKLSIKKNKSKTITPVIVPFTCKMDVTYRSSNTKVATVSKKGKIKARKKGKTVIIVECGTLKKKCKVTVK